VLTKAVVAVLRRQRWEALWQVQEGTHCMPKLFMGLNSTPGEPITLSYHKLPELSLRLELYKIYNELKLLFSAEQESLLNPSHFHFFPKPCPGIDK
jgi:hypothetical protein